MMRRQKFKTRINGRECYGVAFYSDGGDRAQPRGGGEGGPFGAPSGDVRIYSIMCLVDGVVTPVFYKRVLQQGVEVLPAGFEHEDIDRIVEAEEARQAAWRERHPAEAAWAERIGINTNAAHAHDIVRTIHRLYLEGTLSLDQAYGLVVDLFRMNNQGLVWRARSMTDGDHAHEGDMVYGYLYILESPLEPDSYGPPRYFIGFYGSDGGKREYEIDPETLEIVVGEGTPEHRAFRDKLAALELKPFLDSLETPRES